MYANSPNDIRYMMSACDDEGLGPSFAIYEPAFLRMVLGYYQSGKLPAGSLVKFYFSGDSGYLSPGYPTFSAPPIPEALALYRAMLGDADLPWAVTVLGGDITDTPVASLALEQGGHIRVGIEDFADADSNVACVQRAVALAEKAGRSVATPAEAAEILRLPARAVEPVAARYVGRVARLADRHPENADGEWYVDTRCIDCDVARHHAPDLIVALANGQSVVSRQPETAVEELAMWRAALACPTRSIGTVDRRPEPPDVFPWEVTPGAWLCGHNDRRSFGAHSWFVPEVGGGFLVDSPHWSADVVEAIEAHGGIAHVLLTHQDDVADAEKFADHFGARVWIHEADRQAAPYATDVITGTDEVTIADGLVVFPVPGHTEGSVLYLSDERHLFTGDTIGWFHREGDLGAFRNATWYSWDVLARLAGALRRLRPSVRVGAARPRQVARRARERDGRAAARARRPDVAGSVSRAAAASRNRVVRCTGSLSICGIT